MKQQDERNLQAHRREQKALRHYVHREMVNYSINIHGMSLTEVLEALEQKRLKMISELRSPTTAPFMAASISTKIYALKDRIMQLDSWGFRPVYNSPKVLMEAKQYIEATEKNMLVDFKLLYLKFGIEFSNRPHRQILIELKKIESRLKEAVKISRQQSTLTYDFFIFNSRIYKRYSDEIDMKNLRCDMTVIWRIREDLKVLDETIRKLESLSNYMRMNRIR